MKERLMLFGYSTLWWLITPFLLLRLWLKGRHQKGYRRRIGERFGFWPQMPEKCLWVHAVSVGETMAARSLIETWLREHPDIPVVISSTTVTGSQTVHRLFESRVYNAYLPWDMHLIMRRLVQRLKPHLLVIMETELWPNLIHACYAEQIPVLVANARLSEKSQKGYARVASLTRPMLNHLAAIAAQYTPDADRFAQLGVDERKIQVTGSIKFDIKLDAQTASTAQRLKAELGRRPIWVAACTHEGEEEKVLRAHSKVKIKLPNALLILVPRHPERADRIAGLLYKQHFNFVRRSHNELPRSEHSVFLVDTLGELMSFYSVAQAAFVGNTLNAGGGHNPIEPAALAKPVLLGPSFFNFQSIIEAMRSEQAVVIIQDDDELKNRILGLLQSKDLRDTYGQRAYLFYQQQQGALKRLMTWIEDVIDLNDNKPKNPLLIRRKTVNEDNSPN
ncbi:MAG: lipid IV(A) 3-deoxy-D-manno-octulosonic acid transferase [Reinekea sp.]|jgi:3-deoxy-D-manno-octulosonic-acid transferase